MSGNKLIDDYLSELMDAPEPVADTAAPARRPDVAAHEPAAAATAPSAADAPATAAGSEVDDPLAAFRSGGAEIGDDEFEAMLDVLQGKVPPPPADGAAPGPTSDPLAAFRDGSSEVGDDEFEAMLDALQGKPAPPPQPVAPPPSDPPADPPAAPAPRTVPARVIEQLLPTADPVARTPLPNPQPVERRRRAEERISAWLRFSLGRQHFAVEVLKVQEVLRLPTILPVRGTDTAMLGVMNLRGQIVPVLDLAARLGFPRTEPGEASRVIVLEEHGETLGLLVAAVADVTNVSDARIERISGTPSLVAAEVVRGIARREGNIVILLDASRLLA